ncbi:transcriptional regulator PpsR [Roseobacter sp. CCS2]|uniref:transcriptional regulator PpsR n=1 Tax=Roseobacter sp. CCS2 TaxID=391593 RepID=UPI0000F40097|nr:transcriptional regulator PpsR [Roseobacter sp. CCS2]EBA14110.1 putative PAS/PAC sensor protein [Roseobacter sp. CCS2]
MTSRGTKYWNSGAIPLIAPEILGDIIAEVADVGVVISETGSILSVLVNPSNEAFRQLESWENKDIRTALTIESVSKFESRLAEFLEGKPQVRPVELNHTDGNNRWESPVRYSFHRIGPDGAILLLGRDLRPIAEMQQQLVEAQLSLERDYETQREYDTRFRVLMESTTEAVLFVSVVTGEITEANSAAVALVDRPLENLIGNQLSGCFEGRKRGDMVDALASQAISDQNKKMTVDLRGNGGTVEVYPKLFRAAGERILLCRLVPESQSTARADALGHNLQALYTDGPDPMVFTADSGDVLSANDAFLDMIDVAHDINVRDRSIADYLQRGSVDFKVMTENAARAGRMRNYATKLAGAYGSPRAVEISVTKLAAGPKTVFAFVIRDANRAEVAQSRPHPTSDESMRSVVELVGSATLKDIVAETTNVVEKMCIETAVELTMNNRVAAAEMLGLSRQSLYVKLRKFDLLSRDVEDSK